ncbi:LOW QUALITY PROTEIN: hypothetical protein Fmac_028695 [Flemingia macrophylla]|uniref:Uncharacterized protein n=1 Tax=Flemingia macrophylla TaxID=520843 RepID=A0ABD1L8B3_9FABA
MTIILVFVLLRNNLEWMSILGLMRQTPIAYHHGSRDKALDKKDGSQLLAKAGRQARCSCELGDSASCESEARLFCKSLRLSVLHRNNLDWMSNQRLMLQTPITDHHSSRDKALDREDGSQLQFSAGNDVIVIRGVHDMATDTSAETRKLEGKLHALVNLVTQLVANQKLAAVARVCGIRSSNDHRTSVCPSSQQPGVDEHPDAYTYSRPPQQQRQGT